MIFGKKRPRPQIALRGDGFEVNGVYVPCRRAFLDYTPVTAGMTLTDEHCLIVEIALEKCDFADEYALNIPREEIEDEEPTDEQIALAVEEIRKSYE